MNNDLMAMYFAQAPHQLPADYRRVLYLTSSVGSGIWIFQTIDWSKTVTIRVKASMPNSGSTKVMLGNYQYRNSGTTFNLQINDTDKWRVYRSSTTRVDIAYILLAGTTYEFDSVFTPNTGSVHRIYAADGTLVSETSAFAMTGNTTALIIFRDGRTTTTQPLTLYHVEIAQDGEKLIDLIPVVRKADDKPGMYDMCGSIAPATGTPFYTKGSEGDEFTWGEIQ